MNRGRAQTGPSYSSPRGRSSRSAGRYSHRNRSMTDADGSYSSGSSSSRGGMSRGRRGNASPGSFWSYPNPRPETVGQYRAWKPKDETFHTEGFQHNQNASNVSGGESKQPDSSVALDSAPSFARHHSKERQLDETEVQIEKAVLKGGVDGSTLHLDLSSKVDLSPLQMTDADGSYSSGSSSSRGGMSRGRRGKGSPESFWSYPNPRPETVGEDRARKPKDETFHTEGFQHNQNASNVSGGESKQLDSSVALDSAPSFARHHSKETQLDETEVQIEKAVLKGVDGSTLHPDLPLKVDLNPLQVESQPFVQFGAINQPTQEQCAKSVGSLGDSGNSDDLQAIEPFHICLAKTGGVPSLKPSLHATNRQKRNDAKRALEEQGEILGQGMVLLKGHLSVEDQVRIIQKCQHIGIGTGGFYQPGYRDGAKLHLKMMCLGKNWDPNTGQYGERRPVDGAKPPVIPAEFHQLVERALEHARALVERNSAGSNVEDIIPWMSPDICIVNFYSESGRLGLHQDKDESEGSLKKGLPVVSFSIGDTGEFLYGDSRDEKVAKTVLLESGDVLIFGGKSRHIFHGVRSVNTKTAPKSLLQETNLRPGRLNLTFRQY